MQTESHSKVNALLEDAKQAAQQGKREKAYRTSLKVTNLAPDEPLGWYLRSKTAPSREEQLVCLSRVYSINPGFPPAQGEMYAALRELIKQEPTLAYVDETKDLYQVKSGLDLLLNGQELQIVGKNADFKVTPWWYVVMPDTGEKCWLWFYAAETRGPVEDVPVVR